MAPSLSSLKRSLPGLWLGWVAKPSDYAFGLGIVVVATLAGLPLRDVTDAGNLTMIYLAGVVIVAARLGIGPAVLASVVSVAAFNFFFTRPYGTLQVQDSHAYVTFGVMLVTSLVVGSLTAQVSLHAHLADRREEAARNLYVLTRGLSSVRDPATMAQAARDAICRPYQVEVRLWLGDDAPRDDADVMAVEWVSEHGQAAGRDTGVMASKAALYLPLSAEGETVGVMALTPDDEARRFSEAERLQFDTFATLIASALLRARDGETAEKVRVESENEKLRNVLLASVSHDLRTPLTVMNGGLGQLLKMRRKLPREALDEVTALWGHLTRLQAFVDNLLRLAALTSGRMKLNLQPYLIQEIIGAAIAHVSTQKGERQIRTVMTGALPMVRIDGALVEQVLVNLLDNAIRHTAQDGVIALSAGRDGSTLRVSVADNGPGLGEGDPDRLFEQFHSDRENGSGLGLAICRGVVQAHGGRIQARNQDSGGALFTFTLPVEAS